MSNTIKAPIIIMEARDDANAYIRKVNKNIIQQNLT